MPFHKFKELEDRNSYSNEYGKNAYISSYVHYQGTEQLSIYIKTGYGAGEETFNVVISEHELVEWKKNFMNINSEISKKQVEEIIIKEPNKNEAMENVVVENVVNEIEKKDNFDSMRNLLFESMRMVKEGTLDVEKAKSISQMAQTIINSVKVELDFIKMTDSKDKPKMIS